MEGSVDQPEPIDPVNDTSAPSVYLNAPSLFAVLWPAAVVLLSAAGFLMLGVIEDNAQSNQVFRDALVARGGTCPWDGSIPCTIRPVPGSPDAALASLQEAWKYMGDADIGLLANSTFDESVVSVSLPEETWQSLVESGRAPVPGKAEVLAGALCQLDHFTIDGVAFNVVGRLQRGSSCFAFAYLVPDSAKTAAAFDKKSGANAGWIHPDGMQLMRESDEKSPIGTDFNLLPEMVPTTEFVSIGSMILTVLTLTFGAVAQLRFLRWLRGRYGILTQVVDAMDAHPRWLNATHVLCYGTLVAIMLVALSFPRLNAMAVYFITQVFSKGSLKYIGKAYLSGNIVSATVTTFFNNFIVETALFSMLPSLIIPFFALPKTMMNLLVAGFVIAPLWVGFVGHLSYHSITMTLEIEAYIVATFVACVYPGIIWRGIREGHFGKGLANGVRLMLNATGLAGVMLFIAAAYEAATIIISMR